MEQSRRATAHLSERERACLQRYVALLQERLGENLLEVWLFGSAARGDMWSQHMPMHSDIDILVLTEHPVAEPLQEELCNETYPLFLECGRQIAPQFRTRRELGEPSSERDRGFLSRVMADRRILHPPTEGEQGGSAREGQRS
jgi:predicted nucleotidyltransferase